MNYETDGIDDFCCENFEKAYDNDDIVALRYDAKIVFRCYQFYLEEYNEYEIHYCPFCGEKIVNETN